MDTHLSQVATSDGSGLGMDVAGEVVEDDGSGHRPATGCVREDLLFKPGLFFPMSMK